MKKNRIIKILALDVKDMILEKGLGKNEKTIKKYLLKAKKKFNKKYKNISLIWIMDSLIYLSIAKNLQKHFYKTTKKIKKNIQEMQEMPNYIHNIGKCKTFFDIKV